MEVNFFYSIVGSLLEPFADKYDWSYKVFLIALCSATLAVWLGFLVMQGFGLYTMGKKRGMTKKWMAFVPFLNILFLGKLVGECDVFGQKMKRAGIYTMIAQIVTTLLSAASIASLYYLVIVHGEPQYTALDMPFWSGLTGFAKFVEEFYSISYYILMIVELVTIILMAILLMGLYKQYSPRNYMLFGMLGIFIPASRFIIIFVLRNKKAIDFEAYMKARREAYIRQQQEYYNRYGNQYGPNNPYGNPYGRPNNPYGNPYGNPYANQPQNPSKPPEEPFAEFASETDKKEESAGSPFEDIDGDSDGFFD